MKPDLVVGAPGRDVWRVGHLLFYTWRGQLTSVWDLRRREWILWRDEGGSC